MASTYLHLATAVVAILAATSTVPAAAAADKYSGRMVIIRAPGETVVSTGGALSKWQQQQRRLVEDEVAPEFGGLLGAGDREISYGALDKTKQVCLKEPCAARPGPGERYTPEPRPCSPVYGCVTKAPVHV